MTELYVSLDGEVFNKMDLGDDDKIVMKYIAKDLQDLSKVFSPFSQDFSFEASLTNQRNLGFFGSNSFQRPNTENKYLCKIYTNGMLSLSGILKVKTGKYKDNKIQTYTGSFGTFMTNLKEIIGADTFTSLGSCIVEYKASDIRGLMQSGSVTSASGVQVPYFVPFMSNNRVWSLNPGDTTNNDNIHWKNTTNHNGSKFISQNEIRPSIGFAAIIDLIKRKYNLDIISPIETRPEVKDAYVLCNNAMFKNELYTKFHMRNQFMGALGILPDSNTIINPPKYTFSCNNTLDTLKIVRNPLASTNYDTKVKFGIQIINRFSEYHPDTTGRFRIVRRGSNEILYSEEFKSTDGKCNLGVIFHDSMFVANICEFYIETSFDDYVIHEYCKYGFNYNYKVNVNFSDYLFQNGGINGVGFAYQGDSYTNYHRFQVDLIKLLPKTPIIDFLTSYLKSFNIKIYDTSPNNNRLFWLSPIDINTTGLEYSKATRDYTAYLDSKEYTKESVDTYNYYNFKHKESKYKSNIDYLIGAGLEYGQTVYPAIKPTQPKEYKVETAWSIIPPVYVSGDTSMATTYGFTSDAPSFNSNDNTFNYTPNFDELTVFYKPATRLTTNPIAVIGCTPTGVPSVQTMFTYIPVLPFNSAGNSLGFSILVFNSIEYPDTLYKRGYETEIVRLLDQNCMAHNFKLTLPSSEIYLNEETLVQGGGQTPAGFRLQNDIIIGEELFSIVDANIDITSGETTMKLLNYTYNG